MANYDNIDNWKKAVEKKLEKVKRTFAFGLYNKIVEKTPVDTGRAKCNWNISINKQDSTTNNGYTVKDLATRIRENAGIVNEQGKAEDVIYISNNLPYIEALEHGHSQQAPEGMVKMTLVNAQNILNAAVEAVNRKG